MECFDYLFSPIRINEMEVRNRIVMTALGTGYTINGRISTRLIDFYAARAQGGVGMIVAQVLGAEETLEDECLFERIVLNKDEEIDEFRRLTSAIHSAGAKITVQIVHPGRQAMFVPEGEQPLAPSAIPCPVCRKMPRELSVAGIRRIHEEFTDAAKRAKEAGFDAVEYHGAHGYLISEFLSKDINVRTDQYGGTPENRARFACDLIRMTRDKVGQGFPIGIRLNGDDFVEGGSTIEDAVAYAAYLADAGADYINVTGGRYGSSRASVPPIMEPKGCYSYLAGEVKKRVKIPIVTVGRMNDAHLAEGILRNGTADLIGLARPLIADPELPNKWRRGDLVDVAPCIACNQGCIDRQSGAMSAGEKNSGSITCMVNPLVGKETSVFIVPSKTPKKVLIAGGGPGGMEAAHILALRGHEVILCEEKSSLGGQINFMINIPGMEDMLEMVDYYEAKMHRNTVDVRLNTKVDASYAKQMRPDVIVIATGAVPLTPPIQGIDRGNVVYAWDVLSQHAEVGNRVLVIGGGSVGLEVAHFLGHSGRCVVVAEQAKVLASDMSAINRFYLRSHLERECVELRKETRISEISDRGVSVFSKQKGEEILVGFDTIVVACGVRANAELAGKLTDICREVYVIGDAAGPRKAIDAISDGNEIGLSI